MANKRAMVVRCKVCPRPSVAICVACQHHFCVVDFAEHRQAFSKYVNDAHDQCPSLLECLAEFQPVEKQLRSQIEDWKRNLIEKIDCAANKANNELDNLLDSIRRRFEDGSLAMLNATSESTEDRSVLLEKLHSEYEHALSNIHLIPHNDRELILEVQAINLIREESPLEEFIRVGPYQQGVFQPQSVLAKRLVEEPFATTPVGSYWTAEGSDTHLLVQEYETKQLTLFDRHGKRGISMTWHYGAAVSATRVYQLCLSINIGMRVN